MKYKLFEARLNENGELAIPLKVLQEMGLTIGDTVEISYPSPTETIERCLRIEGYYAEDDTIADSLYIPNEILSDCGLTDKPIHMLALDEEIIITSSDKICEVISKTIIDIFQKFGISKEQVALSIAEIKSGLNLK